MRALHALPALGTLLLFYACTTGQVASPPDNGNGTVVDASFSDVGDGSDDQGMRDARPLTDAPPIGIGYVQQPGQPLRELQAVTARETFGDNDLPTATAIVYGDVTATIDIRGHAPVLLTSPDGRISHFPRAWATVTTDDGRTGVGWVEWNRNQR